MAKTAKAIKAQIAKLQKQLEAKEKAEAKLAKVKGKNTTRKGTGKPRIRVTADVLKLTPAKLKAWAAEQVARGCPKRVRADFAAYSGAD